MPSLNLWKAVPAMFLAASLQAGASLVALDLNGTLPGGGTIVGSVSYDTTTLDTNPNIIQGIFQLTAWDITVTPAAPDPGFRFDSAAPDNFGSLRRTTDQGLSWIEIFVDARAGFDMALLSLNFEDIELPSSPNVAPDFEDYGAFIPSALGGALRSEYTYDGMFPPSVMVIPDDVALAPEPSAALLGLLGAGAVFLRRRRS
ncbi:MAG: PEP-CTERM sorting domain-containing protein [Luteolibacter sp.]